MGRNCNPRSDLVTDLLRRVFHIPSFRDHQSSIVDRTLSGRDVFVIMRTGGGKSLTYQLPSLLEGRYLPQRQITVVVSPLLSLIRDQEEQMNQYCEGSALAFTSGLPGGSAEHARRWNLVRDIDAGVCMILVTPEKVKSNKFKCEMQKLHDVGRLGRFVIDECHCACQWGHDFRPEYAKLGILKTMCPDVPLLAVTATASDRVREDCSRILRIGTNYDFFRSTFDRPNLQYSVKVKPEGGRKVAKEMASYIQSVHKDEPGIVYACTRKECDDVAGMLCDFGVVARSYHSDVSNIEKERVHRSWMRNETQVVVATIAFGLGINKPDVRFVLHHCISKSLEAYYQESGRAGRDGKPANCVLYYSPRDAPRVLCMAHGSHGEPSFWSMVRYGQASGDDALCRGILLSVLGEPGAISVQDLLQEERDGYVRKDVGRHAQIVTRIVRDCAQNASAAAAANGKRRRTKDDATLSKLMLAWRAKNPEQQYIRDYPPAPSLSRDECERIVLCLMIEDVLKPKVVYGSYCNSMYIHLGPRGQGLASSPEPHVVMSFPIRQKAGASKGGSSFSSSASKSKKRSSTGKATTTTSTAGRKSDSSSGGGWISSKRQDPMLLVEARKKSKQSRARRSTSGGGSGSGSAGASPSSSISTRGGRRTQAAKRRRSGIDGGGGGSAAGGSNLASPGSEVIELDMSSSSEGDYECPLPPSGGGGGNGRGRRKGISRTAKGRAMKKMRKIERDFFDDSSDDED